MAEITRFAPSPTGPLHLGHAFAALTAARFAGAGGRMLLRIEDIDRARCKPEYEAAIFDDLRWLGLDWPEPVMRQSERGTAYAAALEHLRSLGVTYHCRCTRGDIRAALSAPQEGAPMIGPDGPIYPGTCREAGHAEGAIRLDMARAVASVGRVIYEETGTSPRFISTTPEKLVTETGDIILARRDIGVAYHLAVVVDDAAQGVTLVTRGADLAPATPVQVLLQRLLDLPTPRYHHHRLIRDETGKRLAKRDDARALSVYRAQGMTPEALRATLERG